ncbi:hypothetical protein [Alkalicoccobacillus plakortidis]|nr:hypothetical protein [Alkalicoccobacillus plakortidis]
MSKLIKLLRHPMVKKGIKEAEKHVLPRLKQELAKRKKPKKG